MTTSTEALGRPDELVHSRKRAWYPQGLHALSVIALAVALSSAACGEPDHPHMPGQDEAVRIIWNELWGMDTHGPYIEWITGDALNCMADGTLGWKVPAGCAAGMDYPDSGQIQVAWQPSGLMSDTGLAHELRHVYLSVWTGEPDERHAGPDWQPGGAVEAANQKLKGNGL